jgi:predicted nuclease of restriction endonuclease-like (RecB) superfamily
MGGAEMNQEEVMDKPAFVYRDGMLADMEYVEWLSNVKARFRQSQIKASIRVNTAMLEFYWSIGRDLVTLRAEKRWGAGVVKQFALDMRQAFPNETGFSDTNVKYMKRWYSFYFERVTKGQQVADQMKGDKKSHQLGDQIETAKKSHQVGDQLEMPELFGKVPWRHHVQIFSHCATLDEALFYLNKIIEEGWSRSWLEDQIAAKLFLTQGSAVTNFSQTLPLPQSQLAKEILKDPYHFDFLTMKEKYDEHDLEEALVANVTQFLLELGKGFSYVGRQMELQMPGGQTFFPDLVFYHIPQHRYVIIELKAVKYIPEFAGKLNFYVTAADKLLRGDGDNPSVGLIICKSTDKTIVEWSLQDIQKPLGVATYQLQEVVDRTVAELELRKKQKEDEA